MRSRRAQTTKSGLIRHFSSSRGEVFAGSTLASLRDIGRSGLSLSGLRRRLRAADADQLDDSGLDMEAAYRDAACRSNPDFLNRGSGTLAGLTLAPGLYRWGTSVTIPDDVTISGGANDVWIFQIADDLDLATAKSIILDGAAEPENIFWQVAGQATIHASGHFEGILLSQTGVTLQTAASMRGRIYAQSLTALDNNAVTAP